MARVLNIVFRRYDRCAAISVPFSRRGGEGARRTPRSPGGAEQRCAGSGGEFSGHAGGKGSFGHGKGAGHSRVCTAMAQEGWQWFQCCEGSGSGAGSAGDSGSGQSGAGQSDAGQSGSREASQPSPVTARRFGQRWSRVGPGRQSHGAMVRAWRPSAVAMVRVREGHAPTPVGR